MANGTRSRASRHDAGPLVIVRTVAERQVIVAASDQAYDLGVREGMTLTQARALHAGVVHAEQDVAGGAGPVDDAVQPRGGPLWHGIDP